MNTRSPRSKHTTQGLPHVKVLTNTRSSQVSTQMKTMSPQVKTKIKIRSTPGQNPDQHQVNQGQNQDQHQVTPGLSRPTPRSTLGQLQVYHSHRRSTIKSSDGFSAGIMSVHQRYTMQLGTSSLSAMGMPKV